MSPSVDRYRIQAPQSSISENVRERREANAEMDVDLPYRLANFLRTY